MACHPPYLVTAHYIELSETIMITLARKQKLTTESNVSEAIQQPSSVKY